MDPESSIPIPRPKGRRRLGATGPHLILLLQAKAPIVEELEDELLGIQAQSAAAYNARVQVPHSAPDLQVATGQEAHVRS